MISVVIPTRDDAAGLSDTLASLVTAAVDGLVREVIVADGGSGDATLEIADDAGARILRTTPERRLAEGCAVARSDWVLILPPGRRMSEGWEGALAAHISSGALKAGSFRGGGLLTGRAALRGEGLLVTRRLLAVGGGFESGPLRLAPGQMTRLPIRLI
jgi:cellulose synthase/poly-beta-1,6-N-acetylglucosamine synthase-like glycosyltransferase